MSRISSQPVYVIDALRTPIITPRKNFKTLTAVDLAAAVIKEIIIRSKIKPSVISQVILGNVVSAGLGQNFARQAALAAGLSDSTLAYSVNNVCGAGLQAILSASQSICLKEADLVLAGGAESASQAPVLSSREKNILGQPIRSMESLARDGLFCCITNKKMGELAEEMAKKFHISRWEQDEYAARSHALACSAQTQKKLENEIVPVSVPNGKMVSRDDRPRESMSTEALGKLKPVFARDGTLTAGNSSSPCDGAAVVLLASAEAVKKYKLVPRVKIIHINSIAVTPRETFESAVLAIKDCLKKTSQRLEDVDLFEVSEAFAVQAIFTRNQLKIPRDKLNVFGGDVAFGHPLGAAGARVLVTLINALYERKLRRGIAAVSYGGGGGMGALVEVVKKS